MGFPVNYELGRAVSDNMAEMKRKAIYEGCKNYVVKLICLDTFGNTCGFFNGFMYCSDEPLILTSGHMINFNGATRYQATFFQGTACEQRVELQLVKTGFPIAHTSSNGTPCVVYNPDTALFKYDAKAIPPHPLRPYAAQASVGDTVFIAGFKGKEEPQLSFSDGIVSWIGWSKNTTEMHVTAYADNGYSGSPVFNADGYVIGMVKGGDGHTIKQVVVVPVANIHQWLGASEPVQPGFKG
jgi:hypothetical protein